MYIPYSAPISIKAILFDNNKVWLRKNQRNEWELPGGKMDPSEQPEDTIRREIKEELGFEIEVKEIVQAYLYRITSSSDESKGVLVVSYLCKILNKKGPFETQGEAGEAKFEKFPFKEIEELNMPEFYKTAISKAYPPRK